MKRLFESLLASLLFASTIGFAQPGSNKAIPELVFQNATLLSGTAGQDGAVYLFKNVATDIDATIKITRRSSSAVVLTSIDVPNLGWSKAFQPQLGIPGNVSPGQTWWMEFEMKFLKAGSDKKMKIKTFNVTALDVDGDSYYIQEFVQMEKTKAVSLSSFTYLSEQPSLTLPSLLNTVEDDVNNLIGKDRRIQGRVQNFKDIDTSATSVMATYTYEDKDAIKFLIGAKSSGGISNAGERLNSLWFKAFSLEPQKILPVKLSSFSAVAEKKDVSLNWTTASEIDFSHYVVERSTDGRNYSALASISPVGSANSTTNYQYKDKNVASSTGVTYYRLRLVEQTGEVSYSQIRSIRLNKVEITEILTYPNPAKDQLRVTLPGSWQGKEVQIELYASTGVRLQSQLFKSASQTETIAMGSLPKGIYLLQASNGEQRSQQRVLKD